MEYYRILHQLARSDQELGEVEPALKYYQQALELCPAEDEKEKATIIHNLAGIYQTQGEIEQAIAFYQQSLELTERIEYVQGKAATLANLGQLLADKQGDFDTAVEYLQQSLAILQRLGSTEAEKVQEILNQVMFTRFLQQSPEAQQLWQQLQSADEETHQKILARLQQLLSE